jgi:hypothetical protein
VSSLREALEDSDIPYRVELWDWDKVPPEWKAGIKETGVRI